MKRICLGKIASAHGVKGLVKLLPYGEDAGLLEGTLFTAETGDKTLSITLKNGLGKYILASVEGVHDKTQADAIRGTELWIPRDALPALADGEFYIEDLAGLDVIDENSSPVGKVLEVHNFGAGDLLEIKPLSGQSFMLPFSDKTILDVSDTVRIANYESFVL